MTATLRLSDAEVGYQDTTVLTGLDLTVRPGELLAVLGPSGCGKSTLLRALAGLLPVRAGTVFVDDTPLTGRPAGLPLVFQDDGLLPWRSVLRNVTLPLAISGVPRAERRDRALSWLDRVGLAGYEHHLPRQLSGGMRQRVQLARALAGEPRVVLMDEPFGALDPRSRRAMQELLRDVREATPVTVVFVTHDVSEALLLADRIIVLGGRPAAIVAETDTLSVDAARDRVLAALTDPVEVPA